MNTLQRLSVVPAILALSIAAPGLAWAQGATSDGATPNAATMGTSGTGHTTGHTFGSTTGRTAAMTNGGAGEADAANWQAHVDQRITQLHEGLGIGQAQEPAFDRFAEVMQKNAELIQQAVNARAQKVSTENAVDNLKDYAALARQHAENTERLSAAFQSFYDTLTPQQKRTADEMFRDRSQAAAARHSAAAQAGTTAK